jgi:ribonucleoside-triphosphate reductase
VNPEKIPDVRPLAQAALKNVQSDVDKTIEIESIQDAVEKTLMEAGHHDVAKSYILFRANRDKVREDRLSPDNMAMADYIHIAKYARYNVSDRRREVHTETVLRVEDMHVGRFPELEAQIRAAFKFVHRREVLPSMRAMQFGGAPALDKNARMYNCSFSAVDRLRVFQETFYLLLCGAGVGFSVQWDHVKNLPSLKAIDKGDVRHFTIPDSIEGWSDSLGELITSYVDGYFVEFNYSLIRGEGSLVRSGGKAPGHLPLRTALESIRAILQKSVGRQLRPIECHDIVCFTAEAVLAGGIRRSSLISLFSPDDGEMMRAKAPENFRPSFGRNDPGLNNQRQLANNSAVFVRGNTDKQNFTRLMELAQSCYGEPGFYFTENPNYGINPCAEISLNPFINGDEYNEIIEEFYDDDSISLADDSEILSGFSFCNLTEINMARIESEGDFIDAAEAAAFIGTLQASFNSFPYLGLVTEVIQRREALLGVSLTGMADNPRLAFDPFLQRAGAAAAVKENARVASLLGIRPAARVTTVKPSGTASVVLGVVGSGIHPHHARRYFRRITANPNEAPAQFFKKHNPHMVEVKPNGDWSIVFPIEAPDDAVTVKEEPALDFLARIFSTYDNWVRPGTANPSLSPGATHNVSSTVTVRDEELESVI